MCGIAGILLAPTADRVDLGAKLRLMASAMVHRGPDDEGIYVSPDSRMGLANRRLAIRDLSPAGHMPMSSAAGDVVITYNGEIYNADDLRAELERAGHVFRSHSDTEVILNGYLRWGADAVTRLRGMFAFAICDLRDADAPVMLLARDHLGIKPIYYAITSDAFVFASELKALQSSGLAGRAVDPAGLIGYLLTGSVPNPLTIYADICALEPSTYLMITAGDSLSMKSHTYWSLPTDTRPVSSVEDAVERCRSLLAESIRIRLVSDVPLGAFLSGGLDSSAVVALMREATSGPIRTCSMVFEETEYSEAPYARAVADRVGAEHFERVITYADVEHEFDHVLEAMDQPSIDGVNTYFVSQTAKQAGLAVALSGLGGDELFGGYPNTFGDVPRVHRALEMAQRVPAGAIAARTAIKMLPNRARWARVQDALSRPASLANAYMTRRGLFAPSEVQALVNRDVWEHALSRFDPVTAVASRANSNGGHETDPFAWVSRAELRMYTHHQLLRDTDVMSMTHSLEVRVPLLDRELVSAVLRMPAQVKTLDGKTPKPLLARAMRGLLPDVVLDRRDKQGFTFPFAKWLRGGLSAKARGAIDQAAAAGQIRRDAADAIYTQFMAGKIHWSRVWALTALAAIPS